MKADALVECFSTRSRIILAGMNLLIIVLHFLCVRKMFGISSALVDGIFLSMPVLGVLLVISWFICAGVSVLWSDWNEDRNKIVYKSVYFQVLVFYALLVLQFGPAWLWTW
jgi:hypothetical protein